MNITIVSDRYYPVMDGVVRFLEEILPRLKARFNLALIVPKYAFHKKRFGVRTTEISSLKFEALHMPYIPIPKTLKGFRQEIKNTDKVWIQTMGLFGLLGFHYALKYKKPVYAFVHSIEWDILFHSMRAPGMFKKILAKILKKIIMHYYKKADLLMVPSSRFRELFSKAKTGVVHLGVDTKRFRPAKKKNRTFTIGYCGRLSKEKDLLILKKAFEMFNEKINSKLLLIGDGSIKSKLHGKDVQITGFVYNPYHYLQKLDVFVLPSLTETTSLATLEAMSCGIPVIVTKASPVLSEIIKENVNGFFMNPGSARELRNKLILLYKSPLLRKKAGENARKTIIQAFTWDNTIKEIIRLLRN